MMQEKAVNPLILQGWLFNINHAVTGGGKDGREVERVPPLLQKIAEIFADPKLPAYPRWTRARKLFVDLFTTDNKGRAETKEEKLSRLTHITRQIPCVSIPEESNIGLLAAARLQEVRYNVGFLHLVYRGDVHDPLKDGDFLGGFILDKKGETAYLITRRGCRRISFPTSGVIEESPPLDIYQFGKVLCGVITGHTGKRKDQPLVSSAGAAAAVEAIIG